MTELHELTLAEVRPAAAEDTSQPVLDRDAAHQDTAHRDAAHRGLAFRVEGGTT
ncbi:MULTISPECIES: hypothetical protein [unclassified Kitasatospora]|uniref:hypothetical protein n=1 Tax=unclassified Kitasatospora TaxID=2633591 RepID=UPI003423BBDC